MGGTGATAGVHPANEGALRLGAIPRIAPVAAGVKRPYWSVMIPTYNCAKLLKETLASVLGQDPGPDVMQIEVVDDVSTKDDPQAVVRELGQGRVGFYRHAGNVGATGNFNACLERSAGQVVHILHGDDYVGAGYYEAMRAALEAYPAAGAAVSGLRGFMDGERPPASPNWELGPKTGPLEGLALKLGLEQQIQFPSIVVRRSVYETIGGFYLDLAHTADWNMWLRVAVHYPVCYCAQALAYYRSHPGSDTSKLKRTGQNVRDQRACIALAKELLPADQAGRITQEALTRVGIQAMSAAHVFRMKGDPEAARNQLHEALATSKSYRVWGRVLVGLLDPVRFPHLRRGRGKKVKGEE